MQRVLFLTAPFLIAILLYLGLTAYEQGEIQSTVSVELAELDYEAYSEGLNTVLFNSEGGINYTLQAQRQVHFTDNHSEFEDPWLRLYDTESGNWNIVADSGTISGAISGGGGFESIELTGNVEAHRLDSTGSRLQLNTDKLTVDPEEDILHTDSLVTIETAAISQSGTGMRADLAREEIIFFRDVRGRYEIPAN